MCIGTLLTCVDRKGMLDKLQTGVLVPIFQTKNEKSAH